MKKVLVVALLICVMSLSGIVHAQIITPIIAPSPTDSQIAAEILVGLVGKYMTMIQQYQDLIGSGEKPDSMAELKLVAKLDVSGVKTDTELDPLLAGISKIAFWVKANIFVRQPSAIGLDLTGSFGNIKVVTTGEEAILVSSDESAFAILPVDIVDPNSILKGFGLPSSLEELQMQVALLLQQLPNFALGYNGVQLTPKGIAHVVRLTLAEEGIATALWVLDETWDLYKVEILDLYTGNRATMIIDEIDLVAPTLPDSTFVVDTSNLAELSYDDMLEVIALKLLMVMAGGVPIAEDLHVSAAEVKQGEQVIVTSNGMDVEDEESELVAQIEYRGSEGSWTPLEANYVGIAPFGNWQAVFIPSVNKPGGSYDFRVTYTNTAGISSDPLELLNAVNVIPAPPYIINVTPGNQAKGIPVSTQVVVTFSQEMDKPSVESAFSLTDMSGQVIPGSYEWSATSLIFKPDLDLGYGKVYSAKVLGSVMAVNMTTLGEDFEWVFTTESAPLPGVVQFDPADRQTNVTVSTKVSVTFSAMMDQTSVESAFSLTTTDGKPVSGSFEWIDNTVIFTPSEGLEYNATYRAKVLGSAKSALGAGLDVNKNKIAEGSPKDDLSWWFSVEEYPVFAVRPGEDSLLGGDIFPVYIVFENVTNLEKFSFDLAFNPEVLEVVKVNRMSFLNWRPRPRIVGDVDQWLPTVIDEEKGVVTISADKTRSGGVSGTATVVTITFQAIGIGESLLKFDNVSYVDSAGESFSPILSDSKVDVMEFSPLDVNHDGVINILDFIIMQNNRGANTDVNGDGVTDILDMIVATGGAKGAPASVPLTYGLDQNYPNPFNPETWIPYQLANDAEVLINIYNIKGQLVKSMDLGYKRAGFYTTRVTAAHWDGTNNSGERVASGVYFYAIKAGNFSATKKMIVME